jgi:predicted RND superfamily exporter protein
LFSFVAVLIGFGRLGLSYVPPLSKLGMLIAFSVLISFISSMTVLPVLLKVLNPGFLRSKSKAIILPVAHNLVGDEK